ncbi:MAG: patatin-like phospholipase family protein, partial [Deltaproteobacteria bacterium]|nr:patatin-like phospholipase family protein [Deltaproteobacteria bacterium]
MKETLVQVKPKNILYLSPVGNNLDDFLAKAARVPTAAVKQRMGHQVVSVGELDLIFHPVSLPDEAINLLAREYFNFLILDLRCLDDRRCREVWQAGRYLLEYLDKERDPDFRYNFSRIIMFLGCPEPGLVHRQIFFAGQLNIGGCFADRNPDWRGEPAQCGGDYNFAEDFIAEIQKILSSPRQGKKALTCGGGGFSGIYYELGVLKCLEDCFTNFSVNDFDMYLGNSSGALVTGFLANGFTIDAVIDLFRTNSPLGIKDLFGFFKPSYLNLAGYISKGFNLAERSLVNLLAALRGKDGTEFRNALFNPLDLLSPILTGRTIE